MEIKIDPSILVIKLVRLETDTYDDMIHKRQEVEKANRTGLDLVADYTVSARHLVRIDNEEEFNSLPKAAKFWVLPTYITRN